MPRERIRIKSAFMLLKMMMIIVATFSMMHGCLNGHLEEEKEQEKCSHVNRHSKMCSSRFFL